MIYSMTGYANKFFIVNDISFNLELKSVNHRFLDITIKSNDELKTLESEIRQLISEQIRRGKVDFKCTIKNNIPQTSIEIDTQLVNQYLKTLDELKQLSNNIAPIQPTAILSLPGVIQQQQINLEQIKPELYSELGTLINEYKLSLNNEGVKLKQVILNKLNEMQEIVNVVKPMVNQAIEDYYTRLKNKLFNIINDPLLADNRVQQEIAIFCQKIDITEELDRLNSHIDEFNKLLNNGGIIGKRLDFICQEMNREANTFGSKSISTKTTMKAVDLKVLIEQIREQVQNVM